MTGCVSGCEGAEEGSGQGGELLLREYSETCFVPYLVLSMKVTYQGMSPQISRDFGHYKYYILNLLGISVSLPDERCINFFLISYRNVSALVNLRFPVQSVLCMSVVRVSLPSFEIHLC